ncbi:MAG: dehydrogenase, short-chain alcohol dehydrogenase like [Acidimicrobiales bacterium]|jgi:NAD(P)-dependent dehydrogenase (short-subunit alcohol dehydrogenase family)|nr:dehydrogenase, short-chain alcohol dehydrogenase like [Acidimicrobiales bacterium]
MGLLDGRVAVVTGSGRGIGREFAVCLAAEGAAVVVNDVGVGLDGRGTDEDPAAVTVRDIEKAGGRAVASYDSVSDFEAAGRIIQTAVDAFGTIDILVNNAGIIRDKSLLKMDEADYDAVIAVHQKGSFNCARHAAPIMKDKGYGRIINITSSAGLRGNFGQSNYGAAKAALMGMTFVWAIELGKYGVTVNAMAPAGFTRMTEGLYQGAEPPPDQNPALNAPLVAFLASEQASYVNGQVLGRTGFAYTIFQTPRQVAAMWKDGGWTPAEVAEKFHDVLGQHLQPVGMPAHPLLGKKDAG